MHACLPGFLSLLLSGIGPSGYFYSSLVSPTYSTSSFNALPIPEKGSGCNIPMNEMVLVDKAGPLTQTINAMHLRLN